MLSVNGPQNMLMTVEKLVFVRIGEQILGVMCLNVPCILIMMSVDQGVTKCVMMMIVMSPLVQPVIATITW